MWNAAFLALGWSLGENWAQVEGFLGPVSYVVLALLAVGLAALIVRRLRGSAVVPPR
jgi:membrane protein DedA with SNARE-associated domain